MGKHIKIFMAIILLVIIAVLCLMIATGAPR